MTMNMLNPRYRALIVDQIKKGENKYRKDRSYKQYRVMTNDFEQYVAEKLAGHFDPETVIEMPKIASINVADKLVNKTAVVYKKAPKRSYNNVSDEDAAKLELIQKDGKFNAKFRASNKAFKYQNQNLVQILPKRGKLVMKSLKLHQYDIIPMDDDPEVAKTIILSVHDRELINQEQFFTNEEATGYRGASEVHRETRDYQDSPIADEDDYKAMLEKYIVWDLETETNFIMDRAGAIKNPLTGKFEKIDELMPEAIEAIKSEFIMENKRLPFIDIAGDKDYTYFIRNHHSVTDFTIEFNAALSDYADTNHMQSKAQAIIKGPAEMLAQEQTIGSHIVLKLIKQVDKEGREIDMDFQYVSPNPDMTGAKEFIEAFLALYLSSRDVNSSEISTRANASEYKSGFDRFLAIFETFSASQEDFDLYREAEEEKFEIIKGWIKVARSADNVLDPKYIPAGNLEDAEEMVEFNRPEEIKTTMEVLNEIREEIELGLTSRVKALAKYKKISEEEAEELISKIDEQEGLNGMEGPELQEIENESEIQPEGSPRPRTN